jgi:hypothetical protein
VERGGQVGAEVDGVEDEINVCVAMRQEMGLVLLLVWGLEFVLLMEVAQVGAVKLGLQVGVLKVGVFKSGCASQFGQPFTWADGKGHEQGAREDAGENLARSARW